jgi:hypothetical protein
LKQGEEKELVKVLSDYRSKYDEFDKAMKKSRETFKKFEHEIKNYNKHITLLEKQKNELLNKAVAAPKKNKNKKKKNIVQEEKEDEVQETEELLIQKWEEEKAALIKERDDIKQLCSEYQVQIEKKKQGE